MFFWAIENTFTALYLLKADHSNPGDGRKHCLKTLYKHSTCVLEILKLLLFACFSQVRSDNAFA